MTYKLYKNNSDFQTAYFIAGSCHTADTAYIALLNQAEERRRALEAADVSEIKAKAALIRIKRKLTSDDEAERLDGEAEMLEYEQGQSYKESLLAGARSELAFIEACMAKLQPYRKYAHLSDIEAADASQEEEWALELVYRAENFMMTQGTIPHDHFATMRKHPKFASMILPKIEQLHLASSQPGGMLKLVLERKTTDVPALLGFERDQPLLNITKKDTDGH